MRTMARLISILLFFAAIAITYGNCSRVAYRNDATPAETTQTEDIFVGNPLQSSTYAMLGKICSVMTRCHSSVTTTMCEAGVLKAQGIGDRMGVAARSYQTLSDLSLAESAGALIPDVSSFETCSTATENLSCDDLTVRNAYDASAANPFSQAAGLLGSSCATVFKETPDRNVFYVATNGNDSNDGSSARPWATITHAAQTLTAGPRGAIVHVAPGTYSPSISPCENISSFTCLVKTTKSGTAEAPIIFISDKQRGAKIISSSAYYVWQNTGNHVSIVGFEVTGESATAGIINAGSNVQMIGNHVHHIPVTNGCSRGNGGGGIMNIGQAEARDIDIIGNLIHDIGPLPANGLPRTSYCNKAHAIAYTSPGGKIQNNIVYRTAAYAIGNSSNSTDLQITNNLFFNNGRMDDQGVPIGGALHFGVSNSFPAFNNSTITNNIIVKNAGYGINDVGASGSNIFFASNILFDNGINFKLKSGETPRGSIIEDPQFVDFKMDGTGIYQLQSSSPAVDAGTVTCVPGATNCTPNTDHNGLSRPYGQALDIGPFEWR